MKSALLTLFIIPILFFSSLIDKPLESRNVVVLELFTSQGCSSCPPADKYLNDVKSDKVIALSYHVDYWNYIGWKDPFSKSVYTEKQRLYGAKFNSRTIYTPQLIINGSEHIVGSDKRLVNQKIKEYSKKDNANSILLSEVLQSESLIKFNYNIEGDVDDKYIRTILVINQRKTYVKRGENRNKELINTNIVVNEQRFKLEKPIGKGSVIIPEIVKSSDDLSLIIVIENTALDITTAAQKAL
ncbi:DUF1223 domain-containing protein [uncultured Winogradskyella sp.]|uniref:DUF1223 domain-containing protein n=1 Tax=uncultured Winogradskyella sp. TaxID=395353 RepID=UPI002612B8B4|nr:DUF1223 domain-containing protein [uncultured Winogradskyella sp.]